MNQELVDILERGLDLVYDGQGYLKRWEWKPHLERRLKEYFSREYEQKIFELEEDIRMHRSNYDETYWEEKEQEMREDGVWD